MAASSGVLCAVTAQDVISPCPGGEGKGSSATSRVFWVVGADVAAPRLFPVVIKGQDVAKR